MSARKYTCANCGRPFFSDDEHEAEALAQMVAEFGYVPPEERRVICSDCYDEITAAMPPPRRN